MKLFKRKTSPKQANKHKRNSLGAYDGNKAKVPLQQENEVSTHTSPDVESKHSVEASSSTEEASMSSQEIGSTKVTHSRNETAPAPAMKQDKDLLLDPKNDINIKKNFENPDPKDAQGTVFQDETSHKAPTGEKVEITANEFSADESDSDIKEISNLKPRNIQINAVQDEASHQAPTDKNDENSVDEALVEETSTPKSQTKGNFMRFLRKGAAKREPTLPSDHKALDPLNTTIETTASSDSTIDVAEGSLKDKKRKPPRSGPMEITNLNLSKLIRQKNSVKERPRLPEYKPLKSNRTRPPPMCMSKRNEEQFQKYVQRQNIGRKFRVKQQTRAF
jgi:hypothetical protein